LNTGPCIYYALSILTELSSQGLTKEHLNIFNKIQFCVILIFLSVYDFKCVDLNLNTSKKQNKKLLSFNKSKCIVVSVFTRVAIS